MWCEKRTDKVKETQKFNRNLLNMNMERGYIGTGIYILQDVILTYYS